MSTRTGTPIVWADGLHLLVACYQTSRAQSQGHVEVLVAQWDHSNEVFTLEARMKIPVADDAKLLAAGYVVDNENGLFQSYFVVQEKRIIKVGTVDPEERHFEFIASQGLQASDDDNGDSAFVQGCWLSNGPTVLSVLDGRLLVLAKNPTSVSRGSLRQIKEGIRQELESTWKVHALDVSDNACKRPLKLHFGGELTSDGRLDAILSVVNPVKEGSRLVQKWTYLSLAHGADDHDISLLSSEEPQEMSNEPHKVVVSQHIPIEINPGIISCMLAVAATPRAGDIPHDILIGTTDRRLLRCRLGHVIQSITLDYIPSKLYFAVVAGGQGVIIILPNNMEQNVIAICADSHQKLQDWNSVWHVVVGDFCQTGQDQLVLLYGNFDTKLACELHLPMGQNGLDYVVVHGFSKFASRGTPPGSQQHLKEVEALDEHKVAGLENMEKALHQRLASGLGELKAAEMEIEAKKELYRVSSQVMQGMVTRRALEETLNRRKDCSKGQEGKQVCEEEAKYKVVQAVRIENKICGTNWILIVYVSIVEERPTITLHDVSLLVSSASGSVDCTSSVLKSLSATEEMGRIVISIPLEPFSLLPGFPVHIFLKAERVSSGISATPEGAVDNDTHRREFSQWLCRSHVIHPTAEDPLEAKEASSIIEAVGDQYEFLVAAETLDAVRLLPERIQTELRLEEFQDDEEGGKFTFTKMTGMGFVRVTVHCLSKFATVTLGTTSVQLLGMMRESLMQLFRSHHILCCLNFAWPCGVRGGVGSYRISYPATLDKAQVLAEVLLEELRLASTGGSRQQESSSSTARLNLLQRSTDLKCAELLSGLT